MYVRGNVTGEVSVFVWTLPVAIKRRGAASKTSSWKPTDSVAHVVKDLPHYSFVRRIAINSSDHLVPEYQQGFPGPHLVDSHSIARYCTWFFFRYRK